MYCKSCKQNKPYRVICDDCRWCGHCHTRHKYVDVFIEEIDNRVYYMCSNWYNYVDRKYEQYKNEQIIKYNIYLLDYENNFKIWNPETHQKIISRDFRDIIITLLGLTFIDIPIVIDNIQSTINNFSFGFIVKQITTNKDSQLVINKHYNCQLRRLPLELLFVIFEYMSDLYHPLKKSLNLIPKNYKFPY